MARASIPSAGSAHCTEPQESAKTRLQAHECELIDLLGTLSWKSLRAAATLVQQMREDLYENDVFLEIAKKRKNGEKPVKVVYDTQKARPYLPVYFSIAFDDPRFKGAAALDWLAFRWTFPGGLFEEGAKVCHYFQGDEPLGDQPPGGGTVGDAPKGKMSLMKTGQQIKITVAVQSQRNLDASDTLEGSIELQPPLPPQSSRAFAEGVRFLIAFGVALAGLEAGALDQLGKLDFLPATLAVVALGFGADSIKNLLTQTPKKNG
jgi:hypothetical protein